MTGLTSQRPRSRARLFVLLVLGIILLLAGISYPVLLFIGATSCIDPLTCVPLEGLSLLGGGFLLYAFNAIRKRDQAKIRAMKIGFAVIAPVGFILGVFTIDLFTPPIPSQDRIIDAGLGDHHD
ncbi:MAG TPA: hypothetical protein VFE98_08675 [Candidatus Bathyarchaeia archaeon]|nr:hypothetical protein [Candidatus Bathyarchaeia archaeon]